MPDLPTITVTAAQATKLLELFGDVPSYKKWLKEAIRRHAAVLSNQANQTVRDGIAAFEAEIPPADPAQ